MCGACPRAGESDRKRRGPSRCNFGGFVDRIYERHRSSGLRADRETIDRDLRLARQRGIYTDMTENPMMAMFECQHRRAGEGGLVTLREVKEKTEAFPDFEREFFAGC